MSIVGIAKILLQDQGGGLQQVSYRARKMNPIERGNTYYVYDLEALVVREALNIGGATLEVAISSLS
jgi:hypothetical protein